MRKIFIYLILGLVAILGYSGFVFSQDIVMEYRQDLSEEQRMLWLAYGTNPNLLGNVSVFYFNGKSDKAQDYVRAMLEKNGQQLPEMHYSEDKLGDIIKNTIPLVGDKFNAQLNQDWIKLANQKAEELKDVKQISYIGAFSQAESQTQININSPFMSPVTFEVYEGTFIIYTEYLKGKEDETREMFGKKINLADKLAVDFLQGKWKLKERELDSKYDSQVPEVLISIGDMIGSVNETEIEAERYLFSGEIRINGRVYDGYTELDPVNMYAYPMTIISVLKEEGRDYVLEIIFEDPDQDLQLYIWADFKEVYEKGLRIKMTYNHDGDSIDTEWDNEADYMIRK